MTRHRAALLLALLLCGAGVGCSGDASVADSHDARIPVRVEPVERRDVVHRVERSGRLAANAVVEVQPKLTGRIVAFHHLEGERVEAGDLLVELDTTELDLELRRAEAAVAQASARRNEARRKQGRARELHGRNVLSEAALESASAEAAMAEADLQTARATRDLARQHLADAHIVAPIAGVLQDRNYSVGDYAAPALGAAGGAGGAIFTIIQTDPLLLAVNVSEQEAPRMQEMVGEEIPIQVDALPGQEFAGVVDYVAPSLDPVAFTQEIRLRVPNADGHLKPGMFARIEAVSEVAEDALVVPADALVNMGDAFAVYVVDAGQARLRAIQPLFVAGNAVAVASGLREGEQVIVEGKSSVREGTEVRLVPGSAPRAGT